MAALKREVIKYLRDFIKKDYKSAGHCYICNTKESLELHHLYGLSELFNSWLVKNKIPVITTVEEITALRVPFAEECAESLSNTNLITLCSNHHKRLHNLYGQRYSNYMVPKILKWLDIQKDKNGV